MKTSIKVVLVFLCVLMVFRLSAQEKNQEKSWTWWNPQDDTAISLEGQSIDSNLANKYDRLPLFMKEKVRPIIWSLSRQSAGLSLRFKSNSKEIKVRYLTTKKVYGMPHMPATGVSGVDLYGLNNQNKWIWAIGKYSFADTISYTYSGLPDVETNEYKLYLPLYNAVQWLEIGVEEGSTFIPLDKSSKKPIVVYGTSIAQGACASRPGMAWTSILDRKVDHPIVNLGFSGNGILEQELVDFIVTLNPAVIILDNFPNLSKHADSDVHQRTIAAVSTIRRHYPNLPIILTEHADANIVSTNSEHQKYYKNVNLVLNRAFKELKSQKVKGIYLLTTKEIGFDETSTVDGLHPSDIGMVQYANAYEKLLKKLIK